MKKFINWFQSFFDEDNGASTTRALTWIWTFTLCGSILLLVGARVYFSIKYKDVTMLTLPGIDSAYIMLTTAYLAAKVGQKVWGEQDSGSSTTTLTLPSGSFTTTLTSQPVFIPSTNIVSGSLAPVSGSNV